jgi:hypothetical protein
MFYFTPSASVFTTSWSQVSPSDLMLCPCFGHKLLTHTNTQNLTLPLKLGAPERQACVFSSGQHLPAHSPVWHTKMAIPVVGMGVKDCEPEKTLEDILQH